MSAPTLPAPASYESEGPALYERALARVEAELTAQRAARRGEWLTFEQYREWCLSGAPQRPGAP